MPATRDPKTKREGMRVSNQAFLAWSTLVAIGIAVDMFGPARTDDLGNQVNGTWSGRAVLVWLVTLVLLRAYQGITDRQDAARAQPPPQDSLEQLRKLGELRDAGVLTTAEFEERKAALLRDAESVG